jgi:hypothetical protein
MLYCNKRLFAPPPAMPQALRSTPRGAADAIPIAAFYPIQAQVGASTPTRAGQFRRAP